MKSQNKKHELDRLAYKLDYLKTYNKFFRIKEHWCRGYDVYTVSNDIEQYCFHAESLSDLNTKIRIIFSFLQNEKLANPNLKPCPMGCHNFAHHGVCFDPNAKRNTKNLIIGGR